jgi:uncharacterized protein (DUF1501 family)
MQRFEDLFLTRRQMLRIGGVTMTGYHLLPLVTPRLAAGEKARPRGSARFCIFVMLQGGQSHVDSWDFKEGPWTPQDFDVREIPGVGKWPFGLYPELAKRRDKFSLVRSLEGWESQHGRGQYYMQTAHQHNPALAPELPPIGTVIAYEYGEKRRETDSLPPYVAFNTFPQVGLIGPGFLPATYGPFHINTESDVSALAPAESERGEFQRRWDLLQRFDTRLRSDSSLANKAFRDYHNYYEGAVDLMSDARSAKIFSLPPEERKRYGDNVNADAYILARNLVTADAGTHYIFLTHEDWDHHGRIYERDTFYKRSWELDTALSQLLDDLEATKRPDGRSVLDETLVIALGEFGRTPGPLTNIAGRDHHQYAFTGLFAGGGVRGGQVLGATDDQGARISDPGWSGGRSIYPEDLATTIYSAMGIDWTKKMSGTPSGRDFYYIEIFSPTQLLATRPVEELFV